MAEPIGIISSAITILDLVYKVKKCRDRIKAAPAIWKKYCDKLQSLGHVQSVLVDMISSQDHVIDKAKSKTLATLAVQEIETIEKQVNNILGAYAKLVSSKKKRVWDWLRVKRGTLKFVVTEQHLEGLIASAEKAKMSLQSAICLQQLEALSSGKTQMQNAFQAIHDDMKEHAAALDRINRDNRLNGIAFTFVDRKGRAVKPPKRKISDKNAPNTKSKHSSRRSNKTRASTGHQQPRTKGSSKARSDIQVNEPGDDAAGSHELVLRDNEVLIMATDTAGYKSTTGRNSTEAQNTRLTRLEEVLESISDDEWERGRGYHLYEPQASLTSTSALSLSTFSGVNTDPADETTPIRISVEKGNRAIIGKTNNLSECIYHEEESMLFCVSYICITETGQTFTIQEPCQQMCAHVGLQIMNACSTTKKLPYIMTFQSTSRRVLSVGTDELQLGPDFTLESLNRCRDMKPCPHTLVESGLPDHNGRAPPSVVCVCSDNLQAHLDDDGWDSDSPTGRTTEDLPEEPARDDDERALSLLQAMMREYHTDCLHTPPRISFGVLVGFLKLIERLHLEEAYLAQCHVWTNAILSEVSNSFDRDAIAWAWVLWKLQMTADFKGLSGIIQHQAKHCIGQETNQYGVLIPQHIARAIDRKRVSVLSQINDLVKQTIETCRNDYLLASRQDRRDWTTSVKILTSSLTVGYLTLEHETFLLNGQRGDNANFDGVSFADAACWIRSMVDLRDWVVSSGRPAARVPFLSSLTAVFPSVVVELYEAWMAACYSSNVYRDLNGLIRRLEEEEDWGVDLLHDEF